MSKKNYPQKDDSQKSVSKKYRLLVVAHPDDETLFFSAALLQKSSIPFKVVCITNGNADGAGNARALQFKQACKKLKVKDSIQLDFPDIYEERLSIQKLIDYLKILPTPIEVYTHGIVGEYGHPHHQDVSFAVHKYYAKKVKIWVPAYNCNADKIMPLSAQDYAIKTKIYSQIYKGETMRFSQVIPNRNVDEFAQLSWSEVHEIYESIIEKRLPKKSKLKKYKWYYNYLVDKILTPDARPF